MKRVFLFLLVVSYVSIGCNMTSNKSQKEEPILRDTVIKDIPEWFSSSGFSKQIADTLQKLLNLESIQNGFDSLQIRLWIECGAQNHNLIKIEGKNHNWNAVIYSFELTNEEGIGYNIKNLRTLNKTPISGWINFLSSLLRTDILNLPDHSKYAPNYNLPNDADKVIVEISTPTKYRLYVYPELGLNSNIMDGPNKLHQSLKLIEREFNYKRPCQDSTSANMTP